MKKDMQKQLDHIAEVVDGLALAVAKGFEDVKQELRGEMKVGFDKLDKKMDEGFEGVNGKIDGINRRIDNEADQRVGLGLRVEKVEAKVFPELSK